MKRIGPLLFLVVWARNKAFSLDRDGNRIQIPEGVWFNNDLTIEAWVYVRKHA